MSTSKEDSDKALLHLSIPFATGKDAEIAYNSLRVDAEPKRSQVLKTLTVQGNKLVVDLVAPDARQIRLSMNTLLDHLVLVQKVIGKFALPSSTAMQE